MTETQDCRRSLEITVSAEEVEQETRRVAEQYRAKAKLQGFRPGKAPMKMVLGRYRKEIRQDVVEALVPRHLNERFEKDNLRVVGTPDITELSLEEGEPLRFKAEFEVAPDVELGDYLDLTVTYQQSEVSDEDVAERLDHLREQKAEYVNVDPRPAEDGDYVVVDLESLSGVEGEPIRQTDLMVHLGGKTTLSGFQENLAGLSPGEEKEFEIVYPQEYDEPRLAGRTVQFRAALKAVRRKEVPALDDDFAKDLGDYQGLEELREAARRWLQAEREFMAQQTAKQELVANLVEAHDFAVPEAYVDRQIEINVRQRLLDLASQGVDPRSVRLDWDEIRKAQREGAVRDVKASLILGRIAEREAIEVTQEEMDRELQRLARQQGEPLPALSARLEKEGALGRIASRIRTDKTLTFLFERARKVAPETSIQD